MAYSVCCDWYRVYSVTYICYTVVLILWVKYVCQVFPGGRCSLTGLLVVISVVDVLVLLLFSFPVNGVCVCVCGGGRLSTCSL